MRRKRLIILALFLFLYIGLVFFASSSMSLSIAARPNISKDFHISSWNETIDLVDAGDGQPIEMDDYTDTWAVDGFYHWAYNSGSGEAYLIENITVHDVNITGFRCAIYAFAESANEDADIFVWNFDTNDWYELGDLYRGAVWHWHNFTVYNSDLLSKTDHVVMFKLNATDTSSLATVNCNYFEITWCIPEWNFVNNATLNFEMPDWNTVGIAIIIFTTGLYLPVINGFFIFLGLIMIPASSLYLVRGGKSEMSTTKLFYVLVVFFIGWALLIGGIMP